MKQCVSCLQWKDETEFNWRYKVLGVRHVTCRECHKIHRDNWYRKHRDHELERVKKRKEKFRDEAREYIYQYLLTHPCVQCGEPDPRVLEFHHIKGKDRNVGSMGWSGYLISTIQAEIDKCEVRYANCHRHLTMNEKSWFRGRK